MSDAHGELCDSRRSVIVLSGRQSSKLTELVTMELPTSRLISAPYVHTSPQPYMLRGCIDFFNGRLAGGIGLDYTRPDYGRSTVNRTLSLSATFPARSIARTWTLCSPIVRMRQRIEYGGAFTVSTFMLST